MHPLDSFRTLAATFKPNGAAADRERLVSTLCAAASMSQRPLMSIQALARHHLAGVPSDVRAAIVHEAQEQYAELRDSAPQAVHEEMSPTRRWITLAEAAVILGLSTNYIRPRLVWPQWRRLWGWPRWTGTEWRFALDAIDGVRSTTLIASLSTQEPASPLPPGHYRHDDTVVDWQDWPGGKPLSTGAALGSGQMRPANRGDDTAPSKSTPSTTTRDQSST